MELMAWHKCNRWTEKQFACPYRGEPEHTDDDEDPESHDWMDFIRRGASAVAIGKALQDVIAARKKSKQGKQVPKPIPFPVPRREVEPLPRAAIQLHRGDEGFTKAWEADLRNVRVPSRVPVRVPRLRTVPSRLPVRATSRSLVRQASSERSLVKSLARSPLGARPWDIGVRRPTQIKKPTQSAGRASAVALSRSTRRTAGRNRRRAAAVAAAALTTAGAVYLSGRRPRGRGGMYAPVSRFRGASPKDFVFVR